jgi:hypothetical protein
MSRFNGDVIDGKQEGKVDSLLVSFFSHSKIRLHRI